MSRRESWLDVEGPQRQLLLAVKGWLNEQYRRDLVERRKAGLERARREGKRLGRPPASRILLHATCDLVVAGVCRWPRPHG